MIATTDSKSVPAIDVTEFVHRGRKRKIFRREQQGNFYIRRQVAGKDIWKSLDTPLSKIAVTNAKAWLDSVQQAAMDKKWERLDPVRSKTPWANIGEILSRYTDRAPSAMQIDKRTANSNANCLRNILRIATKCTDANELRADVLTETTARTYLERARAAERSESGIRSALVQARSVFSPAMLYIYEGLKLPDLAGFRVAIKFDTADDIGFEPIPNPTIEAMEQAAISLRQADPATWLCYMLMSRLGLRNVEVERALLDWLRLEQLDSEPAPVWHLHIPETKGGLARLIRLPDDLPAEAIKEIAKSNPDGLHIIPAKTITDRRIICQRTINRFVARFLPDRPKCAYELRKWAGSMVWTEQGAGSAQHFLGHRSRSTTERYYAKWLRPVRAVSAADRAQIYGEIKAA